MLRDVVDLVYLLEWTDWFFVNFMDWPEELRLDISEAGHDLALALESSLKAYCAFYGLAGSKKNQEVSYPVASLTIRY